MSLFSVLCTLSLVLLLSLSDAQKNACDRAQVCSFRMCQTKDLVESTIGRRLQIRPGGQVPLGPLICRRGGDRTMGFVTKAGEAQVETGSGDVRLSTWDGGDGGLSPRFSKKFFKTGRVRPLFKSAFVNGQVRGNQLDYLEKKCFKLPIREFQVISGRTGKVKRLAKTSGGPSDCVSFGIITTKLLVELSWTGRDDLDLEVIEPDGSKLNKFNKKSPSGGALNVDGGPEKCFAKGNVVGKELAKYKVTSNAQTGQYRVKVTIFDNCNEKASKFTVRVSSNGVLIKQVLGRAVGDFSDEIADFTFNLKE